MKIQNFLPLLLVFTACSNHMAPANNSYQTTSTQPSALPFPYDTDNEVTTVADTTAKIKTTNDCSYTISRDEQGKFHLIHDETADAGQFDNLESALEALRSLMTSGLCG